MMTIRAAATFRWIVPVLLIAGAACDRTDTTNAPVTSTTPAGTSTAPSSASAKHRDEALVRVVHAAPSGNLDLFAGDLMLFDGLTFKSVTPYRAIDGQRYAFALRPAGMTQAKPLSSNTEGLSDGSFYTAVAMPGEDGKGAQLRVVNDQLDSPASGKARLRVIHAGTNTGQVLLRTAGTTDHLLENIDYQTVSGYRDVALMNGAIEIVGQGTTSTVLTTVNAHLEAGRFYTVVLVAGPSGAGVEAFLIEDALSP